MDKIVTKIQSDINNFSSNNATFKGEKGDKGDPGINGTDHTEEIKNIEKKIAELENKTIKNIEKKMAELEKKSHMHSTKVSVDITWPKEYHMIIKSSADNNYRPLLIAIKEGDQTLDPRKATITAKHLTWKGITKNVEITWTTKGTSIYDIPLPGAYVFKVPKEGGALMISAAYKGQSDSIQAQVVNSCPAPQSWCLNNGKDTF